MPGFDIGFGWLNLLLLGPVLVPWLALPAALVGAWLTYRKTRSVLVAIAGAFAGLFAAPAALFACALVLDRLGASRDGSVTLAALALGALGVVALILWVVHLAGERARRAGR